MAIVGKIIMRPMGEYNASTVYDILDLVRYNNKCWISKKPNNVGNTPVETDTVNWMLCLDGDSNAVNKTGDTMTGSLGIEMPWASLYLKDNTNRDGYIEKNTNSGAVNIGNIVNSDNTQYLTINPETTSLDMALTLTRNVNGVSVTYRIPVEEITQQ